MTLDFSRCRLPPFAHQREDTALLVEHPWFFVASEMRTGKTKIVIDAAQFLYEAGVIDRVLVITSAPVRDVWYDPQLGELAKHLWSDLSVTVAEYHHTTRVWEHGPPTALNAEKLQFIITNYEFIGSKNRLIQLLPFCKHTTLLVLDESSFVKNPTAERTKACRQLRRACGRVVLLNGTPISHSPLDLYSQANLLHPTILDCTGVTQFKARYAIQTPVRTHGGKPLISKWHRPVLQITDWRNLGDIQQRLAPYTVRRLQKDCLDLPPKLDPVTISVPLEPATWRLYQAMKKNLVVWLGSNVATAANAGVKMMRLAQITSGFIGGVEQMLIDPEASVANPVAVQEIGREKLDVLIWFLAQRLEENPNFKCVAWVKYRPELFRMVAEIRKIYPQFHTAAIHGAQDPEERLAALRLLKPQTTPEGPVFVGGTFGTGSYGLDMTAAHTSIAVSFDGSLGKFLQSADRVYGPGQTEPVAYFDIVATGPNGQRTIDHALVAARRAKQDTADWTTEHWVKVLNEE